MKPDSRKRVLVVMPNRNQQEAHKMTKHLILALPTLTLDKINKILAPANWFVSCYKRECLYRNGRFSTLIKKLFSLFTAHIYHEIWKLLTKDRNFWYIIRKKWIHFWYFISQIEINWSLNAPMPRYPWNIFPILLTQVFLNNKRTQNIEALYKYSSLRIYNLYDTLDQLTLARYNCFHDNHVRMEWSVRHCFKNS